MYILVCDEPIINMTCQSGFLSVPQVVEPSLMTLAQFQELTPYILVFLVTCSVYKKLSS